MRVPLRNVKLLFLLALIAVGGYIYLEVSRYEAVLGRKQKAVAGIERVTEMIRGLHARFPVPAHLLSDTEFQDALVTTHVSATPPDYRAEQDSTRRLLVLLGLAPADLTDSDLSKAESSATSTEVLGFYNPENGEMYIRSGADTFSLGDQVVTAHEYTHALQDQLFDLMGMLQHGRAPDGLPNADEMLARRALVEGDARVTERLYTARVFTSGQMRLVQQEWAVATPRGPQLPVFLLATTAFPYSYGSRFVTALLRGPAAHPDFRRVNHAFDVPPSSTGSAPFSMMELAVKVRGPVS